MFSIGPIAGTRMNNRIMDILAGLSQDEHGIWCGKVKAFGQHEEISFRQEIAKQQTDDALDIVSSHHSIEVMDNEVKRALGLYTPHGGVIADIGGCLGWHWRTIDKTRPDIIVLIVDFVKKNLLHAQKLLKDKVGRNIYLVHGDATCLPFPDDSVDLYWSSQTLQHVPDIHQALREGWRILKEGSWLINYSLNRARIIEVIYHILRKDYIIEGQTKQFWLARATPAQRQIFQEIFHNKVQERFTEVFFQPSFGLCTGRKGNLFGKIDACLSSSNAFWGPLARQRSFEVQKIKK